MFLLNPQNWIRKTLLIGVFFFLLSNPASATTEYVIKKEESFVKGIATYTLIGKYNAHFEDFEGRIIFDPKRISRSSVYIEIKTTSIKSNFPVLDKIVRSSRLLDAAEYPKIIFQSTRCVKTEDGYRVKGILNLHGIEKEIEFPFSLEEMISAEGDFLEAQGKWNINRKDYNVIWHKTLDKGGVIVGDTITVDWKIRAYEE